MMKYYPVFLDVRGKRCVIVGGGAVAERKARALLRCGARVTVMSPILTAGLRRMAERGKLEHIARNYEAEGLACAFLCIAATNEPLLNRKVSMDARVKGVLTNVVDDPDCCDFIAPSIVRKGDVTIAISTGGSSPALARRMREELEKYLSPEKAKLASLLSEVRQQLRAQGKRPSPRQWQKAIDEGLMSLLQSGQKEAARGKILASLLGEGG
ncbi:MAG: bifunctional precorrin-2 dehydrogenase/sirohydrochlorin ferrochelatase [Chloroflexi bacterium]|nr:bifunctional precorrin-2 dehydrogenase/sirohydrochlorin ferrochelatase [Chloroflexota bacterium]